MSEQKTRKPVYFTEDLDFVMQLCECENKCAEDPDCPESTDDAVTNTKDDTTCIDDTGETKSCETEPCETVEDEQCCKSCNNEKEQS